ncbi:choice-of-anchor L domain-containing protein [Psychroflexus sp. ALD_RP9]|uniref:choice-of-anchor L domain-containing protein n=1 Tax=Psychroflexus sp. ALD_RP9 TaxID=2777186 RepID=UPI001A8D45A5|nr:choice-of-anchor L domain-containing protein [Psychroflexus sp. ALD_RP9]QSS96221.1 choice-of-anchor L domain-containing protein [Psychroflexus sp. ALD_RP9]
MTDGQTVNTDTGNFYDPDGPNNPTSSGEFVYTICPQTTDLLLVVEFVEFLTGPGELEIYDGADTSANLLFTFSGAIDGNDGPETGQLITASDSNNSGCLTFRFSGGVPNNAFTGWNAAISVREPCQTYSTTGTGIETDIPINEVGYGQVVTFSADVIPSSGVYSDLEYFWSFGDGNSDTGQSVQHAFQNSTANQVTLTVTDQYGCSASFAIEITPIVRFIEVEANTPYNINREDEDGNPETITINNVDDLVIDVLVDNDCANVSNINFTGNPNAPSIGYFDNNNSEFPIESGIVFNNGNINNVEGPNQGIQSDGGWNNTVNSEPELSAFIPSISGSSNDESVLTFDFEAVSETLSFDFIFASEEYENYQCNDTFADAFVFILTDQNGNQENLALVPGTTDPISVTTVSPGTQTGCSPVNADFFGEEYYGAVAPVAPIEYQGRTAVLTASTNINPGEVYNIKMIIADRGDSAFDSAIFLSAGSFDFGTVDLGNDILVENENTLCVGQEITLNTGLELFQGATVEWFKDGVLIPGETDITLDVDDEGIYTVVYTYSTGCTTEDTIIVEFLPTPITESLLPDPLFACEGSTFNLRLNDDNLIDDTQDLNDFQISYFRNSEDAENDVNRIVNPTTYSFQGTTETIFVRIEGFANNQLTGCFEVTEFQITYQDVEISQDLSTLRQCSDYSSNEVNFDLTQVESEALNGQDPNNFDFTYYLTEDHANNSVNEIPLSEVENYLASSGTEIFVRADNPSTTGCFAIGSFILIIDNVRIGDLTLTESISECQNVDTQQTVFDLTPKTDVALDGQDSLDFTVNYFENEQDALQNNLDNIIENPSEYILNSLGQQVIYVTVTNNENPNCFEVSNFIIEAFETPLIEQLQNFEACGDFTLTQTFDLTQNTTLAIGNQTGNYNVSYYLTEAEANSGTNSLTSQGEDISNYAPINESQTIYIRIENSDFTECYSAGSFEIDLNNVEVSSVQDLESCIDPVTGVAEFDLIQNTGLAFGEDQDETTHAVRYLDASNNEISNPEAYEVSSSATITVEVTNQNDQSCTATETFNLSITPQPEVTPASVLEVCINYEDGGDNTIDLTIKDSEINSLATGDIVEYYVSQTAYENDNAIATPESFNLAENQTEIYAAVLNSVSGCRSEVTSFNIENVIPLVDISGYEGQSVCIDENGDLVNTATSPPIIETGLSATNYDFVWLLDGVEIVGETSPSITATEAGVYTVEVTNALAQQITSCVNTSSAEIIESGQIDFELAILTDSFQNNEHGIGVTITEVGLGDYEFRLDYGEWVDLEEGQTELIFSDVPGGMHVITARDKNGCGEVSKEITLIDYPEFFTPNADGYNDNWQLNNTTMTNLDVSEVNIFDRYGKHLYKLTPDQAGWDGTYQGEVLPSDDYWFTIDYIEPRTGEKTIFKSHFTLKR